MELFNRRFIENGVLDFLLEEREKGRIRHLGWSFHGDIVVFDRMLEMHEDIHWDFAQIQLNYVDWRHAAAYNADWQNAMGDNTNAEYLYSELADRNIPVVVMEPLLGGRLANVTQEVLAELKQRRPENTAAAWAFRFAGSFPNVITVLSGMTYKEHLQDNLRTFSPLVPLDGEGREFLDNVAERMIDSQSMPCTDCKYCMPWSVWDRYSVHSPVRWYGIAYIQGLVFLDMPGLGRIEESASFADAGIRTGAAFVCQFRL